MTRRTQSLIPNQGSLVWAGLDVLRLHAPDIAIIGFLGQSLNSHFHVRGGD